MCQPWPSWDKWARHRTDQPCRRAPDSDGSRIAAISAMMLMTTSNSISVMARRRKTRVLVKIIGQ
jgi:hypothetical protein